MHVLYLCEEFPPPVAGGIGQVVRLLSEGLVERGHRATVVGQYWVSGRQEYEQGGVTVIKLPRPRLNRLTRNDLARRWMLAKEVRRLVHERKVDIVESASFMGDGAFVGERTGGAHHVLRVHGTDSAKPAIVGGRRRRFSRYLERRAARTAGSVVLVGQRAGTSFLRAMGLEGRADAVIPNPVDTQFFHPHGMLCGKPQLLCIGRIDRLKGAFAFGEALPPLLSECPELIVRFAGAQGWDANGACAGETVVRRCVSAADQKRLHFLGRLPHVELVREIQKATVCILPSLYENFPCAVVEAMACGKPVIASSRANGGEVLLHNHSGMLVDPLDGEQIVNAVLELLGNGDKRQRLGRAARRLVERRNSLGVVLDANIRYYDSCLRGKPVTGELLPLGRFASQESSLRGFVPQGGSAALEVA